MSTSSGREARRVRFSGAESYFIIFMLMFWVLGVLGGVGVILLLATAQIDPTAANLATIAGCGLGFAWFTWVIWRDLHLIKEIEITDDDTWILKSVFGIERARIPTTESRKFSAYEGHRWILVGVARKMRIAWGEIEVGDRKWKTTQNPPSSQREAIDTIHAWMREHVSRPQA